MSEFDTTRGSTLMLESLHRQRDSRKAAFGESEVLANLVLYRYKKSRKPNTCGTMLQVPKRNEHKHHVGTQRAPTKNSDGLWRLIDSETGCRLCEEKGGIAILFGVYQLRRYGLH
eukprot:447289-Amphidinium_carterae.1